MIDLNKYFSNSQDESKTDFFPLMSNEDEEKIGKESTPNTLAILPLKNTVLFPGVIIPITIGRDKSIKLINDSENSNKKIGHYVAQLFLHNPILDHVRENHVLKA